MTNPAVELIDGGESNAYHFFMYMLTNFIVLENSKEIIYYYPNKNNCKVSEELLALLPPNFIRHTEKQQGITYQPFSHANPFFQGRLPKHYEDWSLPPYYTFIKQLYAPHISPSIQKHQRIYISRNYDSKIRHILNENELIQELTPLGFRVIIMSQLSLKEQIQLFSSSDIIISPHGANLAFMLFAHPETTVFEFNGEGRRHYSHIAWSYDMDYFRIKTEMVNEHMRVNIPAFMHLLKAHPKI
jgi:hypothetical protein